MHRRLVILLAASAFALVTACRPSGSDAAGSGGRAAQDGRPNVIVVLVDDMRWDEYGAAGHPFIETPNIDRLVREGASFPNAFATTPLCSPSRASLLTGLYAHANGITDNLARDAASHALQTFPRALQASGYDTAFMGKWHMGNDDSPRPGFNRWVAMRGQGEVSNPMLNVDGTRQATNGYVTDVLTAFAVEFLQRKRTQPFMLFLAHKALHPNVMQRDDGSMVPLEGQPEGFVPAPRHAGRYEQKVLPRRPNAQPYRLNKPALQRKIDGVEPLEPGRTGSDDTTVRRRLEMILGVDDSLGRLLDTLAAQGQLDDTMVIFTSDHGYFYGEHGLGPERRLAYEESIRIPLIVRYPKVARAGAKLDQMALGLDIAPTVLEVAHATAPGALHGRSLVPLLRGETPSWRSSFLIEYYTDTVFPRVRQMGYQAVRTERAKYIRYSELAGMDEIYDLPADPYERTNVAGMPAGRERRPALTSELDRLLAETGGTPKMGGRQAP